VIAEDGQRLESKCRGFPFCPGGEGCDMTLMVPQSDNVPTGKRRQNESSETCARGLKMFGGSRSGRVVRYRRCVVGVHKVESRLQKKKQRAVVRPDTSHLMQSQSEAESVFLVPPRRKKVEEFPEISVGKEGTTDL
jgi:hypothetical protein